MSDLLLHPQSCLSPTAVRSPLSAPTLRHRLPSYVGILAVLLCAITASAPNAAGQNAWINEFHYDNDGPDTGEFVEIVIERAAAYDIADFSLYLINGSDGSVYSSAPGTAFTVGETAGMYAVYSWKPSSIQNGPDGIALTYRDQLLDFISYEGTFPGTEPPVADIFSRDVNRSQLSETPQNESLQLRGAGSRRETFEWAGPAAASPGTVNLNQELRAAPLQIRPVPASATVGDTVRIDFVIGTPEYPTTDIMGAGFQIALDTKLFQLIDLTSGTFFSTDTLTFRRLEKEAGTAAYSVTTTDSAYARSGTGTLATLHVRITSAVPDDTSLTFAPYDLLATRSSGSLMPLTPISDTLTLSLTPLLELSRTSIHLDTIDVTTTAVDTFTISNAGAGTLAVDSIFSPTEGLTAAPSTFTLAPGDTQVVTLSVQPAGGTALQDSLVISSNDPHTPTAHVIVEGDIAAVVWPGDADNDGVVNALDILPIGQHFDRTGPSRPPSDLTWQPVRTVPWFPVAATYADATGDGRVSQNDIQPIGLNYNQRRSAGKSPTLDARHTLTIDAHPDGPIVTVDLTIPDTQPVTDMLGLGFSLSFPGNALEVVDVIHHLDVDRETVLTFEHVDHASGRLEAAFTRKRQSGSITASGKLASVHFRPIGSPSSASGLTLTLQAATVSSLERLDRAPSLHLESGAAGPSTLPGRFRLQGNYPNPFNSATTVVVDVPTRAAVEVIVYDMLGRTVTRIPTKYVEPGYGRRIPLRVEGLTSGTYFYRLSAVSTEESFQDVGSFTLLK